MTAFKQTMDRLSYGYMMEDMFRGLFLTTEVMFKPKCVLLRRVFVVLYALAHVAVGCRRVGHPR